MSNKLIFIDSFQCLSSSFELLVTNFREDQCRYLCQPFNTKLLDLVKEKRLYPDEYLSGFQKSKERLPSKEKF